MTSTMTKAKQKTKKALVEKPKDDSGSKLALDGKTQNVDTSETVLPSTNPTATGIDSFNVPQSSQSKSTSKPWFQTEILSMM